MKIEGQIKRIQMQNMPLLQVWVSKYQKEEFFKDQRTNYRRSIMEEFCIKQDLRTPLSMGHQSCQVFLVTINFKFRLFKKKISTKKAQFYQNRILRLKDQDLDQIKSRHSHQSKSDNSKSLISHKYNLAMNFQSNFNSLVSKVNEIELKKEITKIEDIRSNKILIESELNEFQEKIYLEVEQQLYKKDHPINIMINSFHKYFNQAYGKYTDLDKSTPQQLKEMIRKKSNKLRKEYEQINSSFELSPQQHILDEDSGLGLNPAIEQINLSTKVLNEAVHFMDILFNTMYIFYQQVIDGYDLSVLQEDFYKLLLYFTLRDGVHQILIVLLRVKSEKNDRDIRIKSRLLAHITPEEVGIDNFLLLNANSPINQIYHDIKDTNESQGGGEELKSHQDYSHAITVNFSTEEKLDFGTLQQHMQRNRKSEFQSSLTEHEIENRLKQKPYLEAVKLMRQLPFKECPFEKLFLLNEIRRSIEKNIKSFWEGVHVPREKLELGADQFISIFIFVILKSQVDDFHSQLQFIQSFNSCYVLDKSKYGHTLQTVITAMETLLRLDQSRLNENGYIKDVILDCERNLNHISNDSSRDESFSTFNPFMLFDRHHLKVPHNFNNQSQKILTYKERQKVRNSYISYRENFDASSKDLSYKMN